MPNVDFFAFFDTWFDTENLNANSQSVVSETGLVVGGRTIEVGDTPETAANIEVGDTLTSELESRGDEDWFALEMNAGQTVRIDVGDGSLDDSFIVIRNEDGRIVGQDDDNGPDFWSSAVFFAETDQTIYISAQGYGRTDLGTYDISVTEITPPSFDPLPSLDWGTTVDSNNITVYFAPSGYTEEGFTSEGTNAFERAQFIQALDRIEAVANVTFTVVNNDTADFRIILDENEIDGEFLAYFNPPGEPNQGLGVFDGSLADDAAGGNLDVGGYAFVTLTHEILHGMGMSHPHDDGGSSGVMPGVTMSFFSLGHFGLNQGVFTTMSYNTGYVTGTQPRNENFGYEAGPMALDIAVLQEKYGANTSTGSGNDTYVLDSSNGQGTAYEAIWDAGGTDEIVFNGSARAVIDLRAATLLAEVGGGGFISSASNVIGGYTIANGVVIENATGGSGNDILTGNDADNRLEGRGGNDTVDGGDGEDTFAIDLAAANVTVNEVSGGYELVSSLGTDQLSNIELIEFSDGTLTIEEAATGEGDGGEVTPEPVGLGRIFAQQHQFIESILRMDVFSFNNQAVVSNGGASNGFGRWIDLVQGNLGENSIEIEEFDPLLADKDGWGHGHDHDDDHEEDHDEHDDLDHDDDHFAAAPDFDFV